MLLQLRAQLNEERASVMYDKKNRRRTYEVDLARFIATYGAEWYVNSWSRQLLGIEKLFSAVCRTFPLSLPGSTGWNC